MSVLIKTDNKNTYMYVYMYTHTAIYIVTRVVTYIYMHMYISSSIGFFLNPVSNISVTNEHISSQYGLTLYKTCI